MKGQTSMEYLAVYGFGIAVILGTIATFMYLTGDTDDKIPSDCKISTEMSCIDHEIVSGAQSTLFLENKKEKLFEVSLICDFSGTITKSSEIPIVNRGEKITISCDTPNSIKSGEQVKIETSIEYHLNLTQRKNFRYYHGTVMGKAK